MMHLNCDNEDNKPIAKRRGTVSLTDGADRPTLYDSGDHKAAASTPHGDETTECESKRAVNTSAAEELYTDYQAKFGLNREMKIVIKKTVELVSDMSKSSELVFHAVRACARFSTYPTPSIPSDNFVFGHLKGWVWLIHKGLSHFSHDKTGRKDLDLSLKTFRREMSLLAKEAYVCVTELSEYISDLKKLNFAIRKDVKLLKKHKTWATQMERYSRYVDEVKTKKQLLVDTQEDRFFPTDWIFEPHPSQTKLQWDFFHFQWIDLKRDWIDCEFEVRSDYSLHWRAYTSFTPRQQTAIIVHIIQHLKALVEECHNFHKINMRLSFDYQEIKFLKFAVDEIVKLKRYHEAVDFITGITKKLFEDLAVLEKICDEYLTSFEWVVTILEPCYHTMNTWLADDLILPLEFSPKIQKRRKLFCECTCIRRKKTFLEMFGEPLKVVLLRSPISMVQLDDFFPPQTRLDIEIAPSAAINSFGVSGGYMSSIFDAGLGRDHPLPIHHPLPKYKKRQEQKYNIFEIHRLNDATAACIISQSSNADGSSTSSQTDVDTEKFLAVVEEIQRFLAIFSSIFSFITYDLKERMETLELLMYNNLPEYYGSLEKIIVYETSKQIETSDKSGTRAFGRLLRIFQFVVYFLEKANSMEDSDSMYAASKVAYYKSYGKLQSWIYQKAATFSMYSLPSKVEVFSSIFNESDSNDIEQNINEFVTDGYKLIEICENILKNNNITTIL